MLRKFYDLRKEVKLALIENNYEFDFSSEELEKVKEICDVLSPIEWAVMELSRENSDLLQAEKIIGFTVSKLQSLNTPLSKILLDSFLARINERQVPELVHLMHYLRSYKFLQQNEDHLTFKISRYAVTNLATSLLKRLYPAQNNDENQSDGEETQMFDPNETQMFVNEEPEQISMSDEYASFSKSFFEDSSGAEESSEITLRMVKNEMSLYEATKGQTRPVHLEQLYRSLKSIKPSSIDPERGFSAMGYFCTKIRSRMGDDVLDAIIFMQQYYKNNESNSQGSETPKIQNNVISRTPGTSRSQSRMNQTAAIITTPDQNTTISADPAIMKRGRVEYGSGKGGKKSRPDTTTIAHVESDEDIDLDNTQYTQIQFESNKKIGTQATPRNQNNQTHVIRCKPGTSRSQGQETPKSSRSGFRFRNSRNNLDETAGTSRSQSTRGSMFQAPQANNSVFTFRNSRKVLDETISADPAIKKRGPAQDFDDAFIDD
jgi:hypothetical protein